jgi:hypothetical protein
LILAAYGYQDFHNIEVAITSLSLFFHRLHIKGGTRILGAGDKTKKKPFFGSKILILKGLYIYIYVCMYVCMYVYILYNPFKIKILYIYLGNALRLGGLHDVVSPQAAVRLVAICNKQIHLLGV